MKSVARSFETRTKIDCFPDSSIPEDTLIDPCVEQRSAGVRNRVGTGSVCECVNLCRTEISRSPKYGPLIHSSPVPYSKYLHLNINW